MRAEHLDDANLGAVKFMKNFSYLNSSAYGRQAGIAVRFARFLPSSTSVGRDAGVEFGDRLPLVVCVKLISMAGLQCLFAGLRSCPLRGP